MRASGRGGQHVNRTESAVRATHVSSGVQATAMEERSQHRNRKLALARLTKKLNEIDSKRYGEAREERWRAHQELERGNPVRVFRKEANDGVRRMAPKRTGRAAVFLKGNDGRQWREQLLYACTRNMTYDRQCADSRVRYLLDLIESSGDTDFYRDRIVETLAGDDEALDLDQMFEIAASFAANGSVAARTAMYSAFERYGFTGAVVFCAEQLVILDGLRGLLSVAKSFHEVEADERPWKFGALIEVVEKHHGNAGGADLMLDGFR